jgi:hypothetical protein
MDAATVPAELAHKADHRNMWLTGTERRDADSIVFGFRIPDSVQPGLAEYVEVQRQATHAFAHLELEVPLGSRAMLSTAELLLDEADGRGALPRAGLVEVRANIDGRAARGVADIDVGIRFFAAIGSATGSATGGDVGGASVGGLTVEQSGAGRITGKYLPQRLYDRIRASAARGGPAGDRPASDRPVVEPVAGRVTEELTVDVGNPILGDHETDHISGLVVVCAAERLAEQHLPERRLRGLVTRFLSFIEKSEPAQVELQEIGDRLLVTVVQRGAPCAQVEGTLDEGRRPERPERPERREREERREEYGEESR